MSVNCALWPLISEGAAVTTVTPTAATRKSFAELTCQICGKTIECGQGKVLYFTRKGWPKCCEEVMCLNPHMEELLVSVVLSEKY